MGKNNQAAIFAVSSIILLLAAFVGAQKASPAPAATKSDDPKQQAAGGTASKSTLCDGVDFKQTCEQSLKDAKSEDPRELVQHAFNYAVSTIGDVLSKSKTIQDAAKDPRTSGALEICKVNLNNAIYDFNRSISKVESFDLENMSKNLADLKTWISSTITLQQTCLDAFENTTGDTGDKMKELLKTAGELSSNALAMVNDVTKIFSGLNIQGITGGRSMLDETEDASIRRLMQGSPASLNPNAVVAQDGSGQFKTVNEAIKSVPMNNAKPFVIHIKAGVYKENVDMPNHLNNVVLVGDGPYKTKITGSKNFVDGIGTFQTSTLSVNGDNCILRDLGIENSAGAIKHQAVALRVSGDMAIIYNCVLDGYQDTLYNHNYRQFYRDTTISGTIDFIFGDAQAVFQNCKMVVRAPMENQGCMVTAQGRKDPRGLGGNVLQNCSITAEPAFWAMKPMPKAYLGRPWKEYSRTIYMQSNIDSFIVPEGWSEWTGSFALDTCYYGEYKNRGAGADTSKRVTWKGIQKITDQIAQGFTVGAYLQGNMWIPPSGVPFETGMMKV